MSAAPRPARGAVESVEVDGRLLTAGADISPWTPLAAADPPVGAFTSPCAPPFVLTATVPVVTAPPVDEVVEPVVEVLVLPVVEVLVLPVVEVLVLVVVLPPVVLELEVLVLPPVVLELDVVVLELPPVVLELDVVVLLPPVVELELVVLLPPVVDPVLPLVAHSTLKTFCLSPPLVPFCFANALYWPFAKRASTAVCQLPLASAANVPDAELDPPIAPGPPSIHQVPREFPSNLKPARKKSQTFGSLSMSSAGSDALMTLSVPLFPAEFAFAAIAPAWNNRNAPIAMPRRPLTLRTVVAPSLESAGPRPFEPRRTQGALHR